MSPKEQILHRPTSATRRRVSSVKRFRLGESCGYPNDFWTDLHSLCVGRCLSGTLGRIGRSEHI